MELRQYSAVLLRWWWLLVLGTVLAAGSAFAVSRGMPKEYKATTTLFINQVSNPGTLTYSDALLNQQLVKTYSQMAVQPVVLSAVRDRLKLPYNDTQLSRMITGQPVQGTQLIEISVQGTNPVQIRDIANTLTAVFIQQQQPFLPKGQTNSAIRVAQPALAPIQPIGPNVKLDTVMAAVVGMLVALGVVALLEYLDDTVKTPGDLEQAASLVALGAVMRMPASRPDASHLVIGEQGHGPASEAYRLVRANLEFAGVGRKPSALVVTSGGPGEGKSTTVANLAIVLAQAGKRVVVVDADLRKPSLHQLFQVANERGLSNLLIGDDLTDGTFLQDTGIDGLRILTSGPRPPNPAELLSSERLSVIVSALKELADVVLIDSPPALAVADPVVIASRVDGTLLVVDSERTRTETLQRTAEALGKSGTRIVGAVLNKLSTGRGRGYYYYYRYYGPDGGSSATASLNGKGSEAPAHRLT